MACCIIACCIIACCIIACCIIACCITSALFAAGDETLEKDGFRYAGTAFAPGASMARAFSDQKTPAPTIHENAYSKNKSVRVNYQKEGTYYAGNVEKVEVNAGVNSSYTIKYPDGMLEYGVLHEDIIG